MSKVYSFQTTQIIPAPISEIWDFFSSADNLEDITPKDMGFKVISRFSGNKIYAGQVIEYTVRPLLRIPVYWMTEITHVEKHRYFVDEQRFGPYSLWHHQHHFKEVEGGVEMTDIVHYKIPYWIFGDIAYALFVGNKLKGIFDFRRKVIAERWT